ncbi:IS3 family transposase [Actinoallomurus sp. CA-150999]|uniref:IS3 family transposase n=1 Tax=Actinoallomurus sp. CA-150999 TaxID=3239887 RepID=UPI003D8A247C
MIVAAFIASCRTEHGIQHTIACRASEMSESWFYKQINRTPTARKQQRARLDAEIERPFTASDGTYGSPRITSDLWEAGWKISVNTVAAQMVELGLAGRPPKRRGSLTRQGRRPAAPDLVRRTYTAVAPDVLRCTDVTQIDTGEETLYLATVEDLFSKRMLGHAASGHHDASLQIAVATRDDDVDGGDLPQLRRVGSTPRPALRRPVVPWAWCSRGAGPGTHSTMPPPGVQLDVEDRVRPPVALRHLGRSPHQDQYLDRRLLQHLQKTQCQGRRCLDHVRASDDTSEEGINGPAQGRSGKT